MRFLIRLIVIVLVAVGLAIVGLLMLPGEKIARIAAEQLSKQTGRTVEISSDTSISLYPTLGVTTGPARIGTADWAKNGPLLTTDSLAIGIDVPALIAGTIRVTKLEAKAPRVVLERAADGRANWEFFANSGDTVTPAPEASNEPSEGQSFDLSLERALISNASLRYIDHKTGTDQSFEDVDLDLQWPNMGGAAIVALGAKPFGERVELNATVADVMGLASGAQSALRGTLLAAGANVAFEGMASIKPEAAMQINADIPNAGALLTALGQKPSTFGLAADFNPKVALSSQVSFDGTRLALRKVDLGLNESKVTGAADIVIALGKPQITAKLNADVKNAGQLMRQFGQAPEKLGLASTFDLSFSSAVTLSTVGADVNAMLTGLSAAIDTARFSGDANIALQGGVPNVTAKLNADVKNTGQLLRVLGQAPQKFGLDPAFDPSVKSAVDLTLNGSDITAKLSGLSAVMESTQISGQADVALKNNVPDVSANLAVNLPNAARAATLLGQPLSNFGLSPNAAPAVKTNVTAQIKGSAISANMRDLTASLAGASFAGALDLALNGGAPAISGNVNANIPSTANLMTALGQTAPDLPKGFGRAIKAKTGISFKSNRLDLSGLSISLDQNALSGAVSVDLNPAVPNIQANLAAGDLDLSALSPEDSGESSSAGTGWSKERIDASALGLINGNIKLKARSINLGKIQLGAADLGVAIDRSRAVVSINDLSAYQGSFGGQVVANNRNGLSVGGDLRANSVALLPLLKTFADIDKISGNANLNLAFLGSGSSVDAIMRSLSGTLGLSVPQGDISGIDLEGLIRTGNPNASTTKFQNMKANGVIKAGRINNNDLGVSTGRVDAKGEGYVDLGAQTMDYLLTPIAKNVGSKERIEVPVRIKGPWSNLKIRPDLEAALNLEAERKKLEEQVRKEVEREKRELEERVRKEVEAEKKKLQDKARAKAEALAREAAQNAAKKLKLDAAKQQQLENAARKALENELSNGLKNLLGGN